MTSSFTYDNFNRVMSAEDADSFAESYTYDTVGNKLSVTDKRSNTTNMSYDRMNRLASTMLPSVSCYASGNSSPVSSRPTTQTQYLKNGLVNQIIDANGNATQFFYDSAGRKTRTLGPDGGEILYSYDRVSNIKTEVVKGASSAENQTRHYIVH